MTAETLEEAGFDWSQISDEEVKTSEGPLTGSRGGSRTTTGARRGRKTRQSRLDSLQRSLSGQMFMAGSMIGLGMPVTGYYACQESDTFTKAIVQLAAHRPEWVDALENLANIQPGLIVGRTALGLGAALAVDRAARDKENPNRDYELASKQFMKFLGVYNAWQAVNDPNNRDIEEGSGYQPPPASFAAVS